MPSPSPFSERVREAYAIQKQVAAGFTEEGCPANPRYIGGADLSFAPPPPGSEARRAGAVGAPGIGIAIVWDQHLRKLIEARYARQPVDFPYVPGLLSFREEPLLRAAMARITTAVDVWIFDGQGRAHPRGAGLATHMGVRLEIASVGAAKSRLVGEFADPPHTLGATADLMYRGKVVGRAVRTRPESEVMYISQGNKCTLDQAVALTLACIVPGQRLPEPTRLADELSKRVRLLSAVSGRKLVESLGA